MLSKNQFNVLYTLLEREPLSQRAIAAASGLSLGTVNSTLRGLKKAGFVDSANGITEQGTGMLEPYRVDNAIIMAAGASSRFAPLTFEQPKGLLRVRGEVLVERQIRQLKEAGIPDITVVVGYMKERFFYLEDKFGVHIVVNEEYTSRHNNSTLMLVREQLGNTYICSSDDYFTENVFERYVYQAYYAAVYFEGKTDEYCLETAAGNRITRVNIGGRDAFGMLGHAYFDRTFSQKFIEILEKEYDKPETAPKLWEDLFAEHVAELAMVMRVYPKEVVHEFESLDELADFDPDFIENVDSQVFDNICTTLNVKRSDIADIEPINQGLTNMSIRFTCAGKSYVYRHPEADADVVINRASEAFSQRVARDLGLDDTFVYEDADQGWKISHFIEGATELDYHSKAQVTRAIAMIRTLHQSGASSQWTFNILENIKNIIELLEPTRRSSFEDFQSLFELVDGLAHFVSDSDVPLCLCHNNFYGPNLLIVEDHMYLIDWEYSGMSDYAIDLGTFICCSDYTYDEALEVLTEYFQRNPSPAEQAHCLSYIALTSYYWFIWALYKEACGSPVGTMLYRWYRNAKLFGNKAHEAIDELGAFARETGSDKIDS